MEEDVFIVIIYLSFRVYDREANGWIRDKSVHDGFIREVFGMHYSSIDVSPMRYDRFERKKEKKNVRIEYCDLTEAEEKSGGGNPRQFLSSLFPLPLNIIEQAERIVVQNLKVGRKRVGEVLISNSRSFKR